MRIRPLALAALLALTGTSWGGEPIHLKVFYAGNPGSDREKDFKAFLADQFARVGTANFETFTTQQAEGYDVVILDWTSIYPRDERGKYKSGPGLTLRSPRAPRLPESYDRPTILIGAAGGYFSMQSQLKIDWL